MGRKATPLRIVRAVMKHPNSKVARSLAATQVPPVWACVLPAGEDQGNRDQRREFGPSLRIRSLSRKDLYSAAEDAATVMRMPHLRRSELDIYCAGEMTGGNALDQRCSSCSSRSKSSRSGRDEIAPARPNRYPAFSIASGQPPRRKKNVTHEEQASI